MSEEKKYGGTFSPAYREFFLMSDQRHFEPVGGLTVRQWFAGTASDEAIRLASQEFLAAHADRTTCTQAEARFWYADSMIAEGDKRPCKCGYPDDKFPHKHWENDAAITLREEK